jgi:hypothetical protein
MSRLALAPTPLPPIQNIQWALSPRGWVKQPGGEADHSPLSNTEVKYAWSYTSTPQYAFIAWCPVKAERLKNVLK